MTASRTALTPARNPAHGISDSRAQCRGRRDDGVYAGPRALRRRYRPGGCALPRRSGAGFHGVAEDYRVRYLDVRRGREKRKSSMRSTGLPTKHCACAFVHAHHQPVGWAKARCSVTPVVGQMRLISRWVACRLSMRAGDASAAHRVLDSCAMPCPQRMATAGHGPRPRSRDIGQARRIGPRARPRGVRIPQSSQCHCGGDVAPFCG